LLSLYIPSGPVYRTLPWSNETVSMRRRDFEAGISTLANAYRAATAELEWADPAADQRVNDLIQIWWEVFTDEYRFMDQHVQIVLADPKSIADYKEAIEQLSAAVLQHDSKNIEILSGTLFGTLKDYLKKVEKLAIEWASKTTDAEGKVPPQSIQAQNERRTIGLLLARLEQLELSHQLRLATQQAKLAVDEAKKAAEDAKTAAGVASGSKLTERFAALAKRHFIAATTFRALTAMGVLAGIFWGSSHADALSGAEATSTAQAILRVSLLAGILGLATYFGRQAAYHRDVSTWASTIKEQLLTFDGYTDPVTDSTLRDQMRAAFAARVFGSSPESKDEPGVTLSSPVLSEVAAMVTKAGSGK